MHDRTYLQVPIVLNLLAMVVCAQSHTAIQQKNATAPVHLQCEYLPDPVGIDTTRPRLSWQLTAGDRGHKQNAYHVIVATRKRLLADETGDLWDTGRVTGSLTSQIAYAGKPLKAGQTCFWKVKIWDETGRASDWSQPARWTVACE
jgi:alpha-L-rhamnosidase